MKNAPSKSSFTGLACSTNTPRSHTINTTERADEDSEETRGDLNAMQRWLITTEPSDLRLHVLHRLPKVWGLRVNRVRHLPPAEWYNPMSILSTAAHLIVTITIGERTDTRPLYALMAHVEDLEIKLAEQIMIRKSLESGNALNPTPTTTPLSWVSSTMMGNSGTTDDDDAGVISSVRRRTCHDTSKGLGTLLSSGGSFSSVTNDYTNYGRYHAYSLSGRNGTSMSSFWFDFTADTGDGWNPTFTIAQLLAQPNLNVNIRDSEESPVRGHIWLPRGRVLVLGGDLVYPNPTAENYQNRFIEPFKHALWLEQEKATYGEMLMGKNTATQGQMASHPHIFAIPGNHDWLDGLVAFRRVICSSMRLGGWMLPQKRSYFALSYPGGWWQLGIDDQLTYDIDDSQYRYFESVVSSMALNDKVIVTMHRPYWILDGKVPLSLGHLFSHVIGSRLRVMLAGDLHNYSRYQRSDGVFQIVQGGGGAFLHPTHLLDERVECKEDPLSKKMDTATLKSVYPDKNTSRKLTLGLIFFVYYNKSFGIITSVLYLLLVGFLPFSMWDVISANEAVKIPWPSLDCFFDGTDVSPSTAAVLWNHTWLLVEVSLRHILSSSLATSIVAIFLGTMCAFVDIGSRSRFWALLFGSMHAFAHVAAAVSIHYTTCVLIIPLVSVTSGSHISAWHLLACRILVCALGYIAGPFVMGLYLLVASIFGLHSDDVFSALRIEHYKSLCRFQIDTLSDTLTVYVVGVDRVKQKWPALRKRGKPDETTSHTGNPLWYSQIDSGYCRLVDRFVILGTGSVDDEDKEQQF